MRQDTRRRESASHRLRGIGIARFPTSVASFVAALCVAQPPRPLSLFGLTNYSMKWPSLPFDHFVDELATGDESAHAGGRGAVSVSYKVIEAERERRWIAEDLHENIGQRPHYVGV